MNRLECQVSSCQHYSQNHCCLSEIHVDGPSARESSQTCCASFEERHAAGGMNSTGGSISSGSGAPSANTSIACKAEHCKYNKNCKCTADSVCVGCCCGEPTAKSGTECCTFRPE